MSQAAKKTIKISCLVVSILCILSLGVAVFAAYLNTNRDTRKAPKKATEKHSEVSVRSFAKSILSAHPCEKRVNHGIA